MITGEEKGVARSELEKMTEGLLEKKWSEEFKAYEYSGISAGLDCITYLLQQDQAGNLLGVGNDVGMRLLKLNEELLSIIKDEIGEHEELRRNSQDGSVKTYYMLLEKKHNYFNPVYEASTSTIYNHPIKTEKERLEQADNYAGSLQQKAQLRAKRLEDLLHSTDKSTLDERLGEYAAKVLATKECPPSRTSILGGDPYIYNVFPRSKARIKVIATCMSMLCAEFKKIMKDREWQERIATVEMRAAYNEQRYKFMITLFRFLTRDEKCLHKRAKQCIRAMREAAKDHEEMLPTKAFRECLRLMLLNKIADLSDYKKIMHVVKLFPDSFQKGFWDKITGSFNDILKKLEEDLARRMEGPRPKHTNEIHIACLLISCYKHKLADEDNLELFKSTLKNVQKLKYLMYQYGWSDAMLQDPLAHLFGKYSKEALQYIQEQHAIEHSDPTADKKLEAVLRLAAQVIRSKKATEFRVYLQTNVADVLLTIISECQDKEGKAYGVLHEALKFIYALYKADKHRRQGEVSWLGTQGNLIQNLSSVWLSYIPESGHDEKHMSPLLSRFLREDLLKVEKLLLGYARKRPEDVKAAYLLLDFLKNPDYANTLELKNFLCYEFCRSIPEGSYKSYVEIYRSLISCDNPDEKPCLNATSYLMIPLFFYVYHEKVADVLGRELEEKLLTDLFFSRPWKATIQRRALRFGALILEHIAREKMDNSKKVVVLDIWKKIKCDDPAMKAWAFMALAKFANKIPMPNERIQEVIYVFLGESLPDNRDVITEAINSVVPVMFRAVPQQQQEQNLFLLERTIRLNASSLPTLINVFGMVVRNQIIFKPHKLVLYPRMIQAFQKIFFYSKPLQSKVLAFDIAKVMLIWSLDPSHDVKVVNTEAQIKDIVATCLFKELFQLHYILEVEEQLDKDCIELTYKCLVLLRSILLQAPDQQFKFSTWDRHTSPTHTRVP